jgi:D-tyrosyl-tRNA(Tyr) deacylase
MKLVIQRSKAAHVSVNGEMVGRISSGLVVLAGFTHEDSEQDVNYLAEKLASLRIFEDNAGKMNISIGEAGGQILSISQFTLYGDTSRGRRPSFITAARPEQAEPLYHLFNERLRKLGLHVETGIFGSVMEVSLINWGPITLILESKTC